MALENQVLVVLAVDSHYSLAMIGHIAIVDCTEVPLGRCPDINLLRHDHIQPVAGIVSGVFE